MICIFYLTSTCLSGSIREIHFVCSWDVIITIITTTITTTTTKTFTTTTTTTTAAAAATTTTCCYCCCCSCCCLCCNKYFFSSSSHCPSSFPLPSTIPYRSPYHPHSQNERKQNSQQSSPGTTKRHQRIDQYSLYHRSMRTDDKSNRPFSAFAGLSFEARETGGQHVITEGNN